MNRACPPFPPVQEWRTSPSPSSSCCRNSRCSNSPLSWTNTPRPASRAGTGKKCERTALQWSFGVISRGFGGGLGKCEAKINPWKVFPDVLLLHSCTEKRIKETTAERRAGGWAEVKYFRQPVQKTHSLFMAQVQPCLGVKQQQHASRGINNPGKESECLTASL